MAQRLPGLFARIAKDSEPIDVVSSGQGHAVDSGALFSSALADADPALTHLIGPARTDPDLLYFHKSAGGAAYRDCIAHDQRLATTLKSVTEQPATHRAARDILKRIFTPAFVRRISDGEFASIGSEVDAAEAVYNPYSIAPAMTDEGSRHLARYLARPARRRLVRPSQRRRGLLREGTGLRGRRHHVQDGGRPARRLLREGRGQA
ncbi:hypothetical protein [Streptomyces mirabilis]|uniref:hypothetical protein n=1 Tax=Streptomyces mirabilis TaxID=68239 RepID=UPI0036ED9920